MLAGDRMPVIGFVLSDGAEFPLTAPGVPDELMWSFISVVNHRVVLSFQHWAGRLQHRLWNAWCSIQRFRGKVKRTPVRFVRTAQGVLRLDPEVFMQFNFWTASYTSDRPTEMQESDLAAIGQMKMILGDLQHTLTEDGYRAGGNA